MAKDKDLQVQGSADIESMISFVGGQVGLVVGTYLKVAALTQCPKIKDHRGTGPA